MSYVAFMGERKIASGPLCEVALVMKRLFDGGDERLVLLFDNEGNQLDVDLRGTESQIRLALESTRTESTSESTVSIESQSASSRPSSGPGRPKLGVVAREVTLLPRHWEWLNNQPGGASVTLRKLVEQAKKSGDGPGIMRKAREAAYRFMSAIAGNEAGFEEASRALFAGNLERFEQETAHWPDDVKEHLRQLAAPSFAASSSLPERDHRLQS
jgi:hypothetical protein